MSNVANCDVVSPEFLTEFADRWLDAWNSRENGPILELVHEEIVWDDPVFWYTVIHGQDELTTYLDTLWAAIPDVQFNEIERFVNAEASRGLVLFEQSGPAPKKLGIDGEYRTHGCDIFMGFKDEKLAHYMGAYDIVGMLEQIGALPPRGGRPGGAYVMSLLGGR